MKSTGVSIEIHSDVWTVVPRPGFAEQVGRALALNRGAQMSITVWKWAERELFGVGPHPRATPACRHAGARRAGTPAGRGLRQIPKEQQESASSTIVAL